jgi:nicotinate-nucleotide adenylyltransferase
LKSRKELATLPDRLAMCERLVHDPRIKITAFEKTLGTSYTAETLAFVKARNPHVHFVWIMGADSLKTFHLWQRWREIASTFPIAVIDRPGATLSFLSSRMARALAHARVDEDDAGVLWKQQAPAWTFIHGPRSTLSSTALRAKTRDG